MDRTITPELQQMYEKHVKQPSDINTHLPILWKYASECDHITELGVRDVVSTWAFLAAKPKKMISVDLLYNANIELAKKIAADNGIDFTFIQSDDIAIKLEATDLIFIDTWHVYHHLKKELDLHGNKSRKFLIFHDTVSCGVYGMPSPHENAKPGNKGIWPAITEFLAIHPEWKMLTHIPTNNGLTVLNRG